MSHLQQDWDILPFGVRTFMEMGWDSFKRQYPDATDDELKGKMTDYYYNKLTIRDRVQFRYPEEKRLKAEWYAHNEDDVQRVDMLLGLPYCRIKELGTGHFGQVSVWERRPVWDRIDRVAIKKALVQTPEGVHSEVGAMQWLQGRHAVEYRGHWVRRNFLMLAMEFCECGDLKDLIDRHAMDGIAIPEPFIWSVLLSVARACSMMRIDRERWRGDIWIHSDLKPANILLRRPGTDMFPLYPEAVVGDFGSARKTSLDDPNNPAELWGGPPARCAPEARNPGYSRRPDTQWHDWTNVWSVGLLGYAMINPDCNFEDEASNEMWLDSSKNTKLTGPVYKIDEWLQQGYSPLLCSVIEWCLDNDPQLRPTSEALVSEILTHVANPVAKIRPDYWDEQPPDPKDGRVGDFANKVLFQSYDDVGGKKASRPTWLPPANEAAPQAPSEHGTAHTGQQDDYFVPRDPESVRINALFEENVFDVPSPSDYEDSNPQVRGFEQETGGPAASGGVAPGRRPRQFISEDDSAPWASIADRSGSQVDDVEAQIPHVEPHQGVETSPQDEMRQSTGKDAPVDPTGGTPAPGGHPASGHRAAITVGRLRRTFPHTSQKLLSSAAILTHNHHDSAKAMVEAVESKLCAKDQDNFMAVLMDVREIVRRAEVLQRIPSPDISASASGEASSHVADPVGPWHSWPKALRDERRRLALEAIRLNVRRQELVEALENSGYDRSPRRRVRFQSPSSHKAGGAAGSKDSESRLPKQQPGGSATKSQKRDRQAEGHGTEERRPKKTRYFNIDMAVEDD